MGVDIIKAIQEIDNEFFAKLPRFEMKSVSTDVFPGAKLSDVAGGVKLEQREDLLNEMGNLMVKVKSRQPKMSSRVLMWECNNKGNNLPSYVVNTTTNKVVGSGIGTYGMKVLPADAKNKYPDGTLLICESKVPEWLPKGSQFECLIPYKRLTEDSVAVRNLILAFIAVYSKDPSAKTNFCRRFNQFSIFGTVRDSKKVDAYKKKNWSAKFCGNRSINQQSVCSRSVLGKSVSLCKDQNSQPKACHLCGEVWPVSTSLFT